MKILQFQKQIKLAKKGWVLSKKREAMELPIKCKNQMRSRGKAELLD